MRNVSTAQHIKNCVGEDNMSLLGVRQAWIFSERTTRQFGVYWYTDKSETVERVMIILNIFLDSFMLLVQKKGRGPCTYDCYDVTAGQLVPTLEEVTGVKLNWTEGSKTIKTRKGCSMSEMRSNRERLERDFLDDRPIGRSRADIIEDFRSRLDQVEEEGMDLGEMSVSDVFRMTEGDKT